MTGRVTTDGPFAAVPRNAGRDRRMTRGHFAVLVEMAGLRDHKTNITHASQQKIGTLVHLGRQRVNSIVADLIAWGYLRPSGPLKYMIAYDANCHPIDDSDDQSECRIRGDTSDGVHRAKCDTGYRTGGDENCRPSNDTDQRIDSDFPSQSGGSGQTLDAAGTVTPTRWATGWSADARASVGDLAADTASAHVAAFVASVCGSLNPPPHADPAAYVADLAMRLTRFPAAILVDLVHDDAVASRTRDLPGVATLVAAAENVAKRHAANATAPPLARPDRAAREAAQLRNSFRELFAGSDGAAIDRAWFRELVVEGIAGRTLHVSVREPWQALQINDKLSSKLTRAASRIWPDVRMVECNPREGRRAIRPASEAASRAAIAPPSPSVPESVARCVGAQTLEHHDPCHQACPPLSIISEA